MELKFLFLQIQVGIAVLIVLLARIGMRKLPRVYSYMLWLLVFARLLFPVSFASRFGVMPSTAGGILWLEENMGWEYLTVEGQRADNRSMVSGRVENYVSGEEIRSGSDADTGHMTEGVAGIDSNTNSGYTSGTFSKINEAESDSIVYLPPERESAVYLSPENVSVAVEPHESQQLSVLWKSMLLMLWFAGAAMILIYNGAALMLVKRRVKKAEHFRDNIYSCSQVKAPFTLGMICPKIYLPSNLEEDEREYIICHEKIHIRRKDYLAKNIAFLLTAVHWFNPFVWVAFYFMERDMEMSCDEKVIMEMGEEIKKQYSQSLLNFAKGKYPVAMTPITFGENSVKQRVSNVLAYRIASKWVAVWGFVILLISAVMMFTVRSDAREQTGGQQDGQAGEQQNEEFEELRDRDGQGMDSQESGTACDAGSSAQISSEGSSCVIRDVGASTEINSLNLMLAQISPEKVLQCWARAFTDRNGDALFWLASDKEGFKQWEMVIQRGNDRFAFGESSPWAWAYDYETEIFLENNAAEITFHMRTSAPEIYLLKEKVRITEQEGLYYVDHDSTWDNYNIETAQEYKETYGGDAVYDELGIHGGNSVYSQMAALYDDSFYQAILKQLLGGDNMGFSSRFTSPVSAARELLHLGEGTGEITEWDMVPITGLRSVDMDFPTGSSADPPYWIDALSISGEGSRVIVSYTFAKDGACVEIPMELKEGSRGIWGLAGGSIREVYSQVSRSDMIEHEEGKADLTYVIELSNYGIYRLGAHSGLTCLWAGDVGPEADVWVHEDKLYIFESPEHAEDSSNAGAEAVFVLDLLTGEYL